MAIFKKINKMTKRPGFIYLPFKKKTLVFFFFSGGNLGV